MGHLREAQQGRATSFPTSPCSGPPHTFSASPAAADICERLVQQSFSVPQDTDRLWHPDKSFQGDECNPTGAFSLWDFLSKLKFPPAYITKEGKPRTWK